MVEIAKDRKAPIPVWTITRTDTEGFHRQLPLTAEEMNDLVRLWEEERCANGNAFKDATGER